MTRTTTGPSEAGFSMIELLTIVSLIGILASLSMVAFDSYKQSAEMAKGDSTYHNARTKLAISELDLPDGYSLPLTRSATDGSIMTGDLGTLMPDMSPGKQVRLSVSLSVCDGTSDPLDLNQLIVVEPCTSSQRIQWTRFCGGIEVLNARSANPSPCT